MAEEKRRGVGQVYHDPLANIRGNTPWKPTVGMKPPQNPIARPPVTGQAPAPRPPAEVIPKSPVPTFQPPAPLPVEPTPTPQFDDSRFRAGLDALNRKSGVKGLDFSGLMSQQQGLQARLQDLLAGKGINVGDMTQDPEAQAYRVAKTREAEAARQAEADRLGASGMTGSGDFDARAAGIREQTGEAIASQVAGLTGRRRAEAQQGALAGAQLTLSDLDRQTRQEQARYESEFDQEREARNREAQRLSAELDIERSKYGSQVDATERALRERRASSDDAYRNAQARYQSEFGGYAAEQDRLRTNLSAEQQRAQLQAQLMQMQLGQNQWQDQFAREGPGTDLRNQLLQQEILRNRKKPGTGGYPTSPTYKGGYDSGF